MTAPTPHWFEAARFGMFIHYGPYSHGRLEPSWPMVGSIPILPNGLPLTVAEYDAACAGFAPAPGAPARWAELAASASMDYAVLTTKHHDGYTLFPSEHSAHGLHRDHPGQDVVAEYVEAMRAHGIRVGLYFSLPDWHHPDYPAFTDEMRPYPAFSYPRPTPEQWESFLADQRGQLDELLTRYGPIDLLWFDGGWERTAEEWRATELESFIRARQPDIVINDRCPGLPGYPSMLYEGTVPLERPEGPWEACVPLDDSWGPLEAVVDRKEPEEVVALLAESAAAGGRLLLNVAPLGDGSIMEWQASLLAEVSSWMTTHQAAIKGTLPAPELSSGQVYGAVTAAAGRYFVICPMRPAGTVVVRQVKGRRVTGARLLGRAPAELSFSLRTSAIERMLSTDPTCDVVVRVPADLADDLATVIELEVSGPLA